MKSKIIAVKQNTVQWKEWRDRGLGASDAPIVMGDSPWTTRFELWAYKTGLMARPEANEYQKRAMQRGHDLEPTVRKWYEKLIGKKFPATSFEHNEFSFLRASLDGYNEELNINLEIKCPGKVDHGLAMAGKVPKKYYAQLQMQMLVSGAPNTAYVSWDGEESFVRLGVSADEQYQAKLLAAMLDMWNYIEGKIPPPIYLKEINKIFSIVQSDLIRLNSSFNVLSMVCEGVLKGETK